jgi:hypothetical protein
MMFLVTQMNPQTADTQSVSIDQKLIRWIKGNVSPRSNLPLSFFIPPDEKETVYRSMGEVDSVEGIIERMIVEEGLVIYDGAVGQIVLSMLDDPQSLDLAQRPIDYYWQGYWGELMNVRAGYEGQNFIYDLKNPRAVSSNLDEFGKRGFIFRIVNAHGRYHTADPLDGKTTFSGFPSWPTIHWEDWKPVAGENAWVVMAALHLYHKKYFNAYSRQYQWNPEAVELKLSQELARAALLLQSEVGGIRMAPLGTYRESEDEHTPGELPGRWWYNQISTENNISWYAAFRMLYQITGERKYYVAMKNIEDYFKKVWNPQEHFFYQGMRYLDGQWQPNTQHYALDVQTWLIAALGPDEIDRWFGEGTALLIWYKAREVAGFFDHSGDLRGVGYTAEHDQLSVEWTAGAILAAQLLATPETIQDAYHMRQGIEALRRELSVDSAAYPYSIKRKWIPFGWYAHSPQVLSLASTGWVVLIDQQFNPFYLPNSP